MAILICSVEEFTLPINSLIILGLLPAASILVGDLIIVGIILID